MKRIAAIACLLSCITPITSQAANISSDTWKLVSTDKEGAKFFIATETAFTRGGRRKIDFHIEHPKPFKHEPLLNPDKSVKMVKTMSYGVWIDCKQQKLELASMTAYDADDRWVDGYNVPAEKRKSDVIGPGAKAFPIMAPACSLEIPPQRENQ